MSQATPSVRAWIVATSLAVAATLVLVASPSHASPPPSDGAPGMSPEGHPGGHPAGHPPAPSPMWPGGPGLSRLLDTVQATPEQRSQVEAIAQAAQADLRTRHEASAQLRQQTMALFMKPTVDTAAAEALRQQMLVQHDQATQRMLQAMVDVSRVLTAEQRQQLAQRMQAREERGGHRHGDRGPGRS